VAPTVMKNILGQDLEAAEAIAAENRPGVLTALNKIFAEQGVNIAAQYLQTSAQMGYVVIDIEADEDVAEKALQAMKAIPGTIRARLLY
jgi:D-3-phosphoglycerate dehydrogenase